MQVNEGNEKFKETNEMLKEKSNYLQKLAKILSSASGKSGEIS